jgi:hypothetical protein
VQNARKSIAGLASRLPDPSKSNAHGALKNAVMTDMKIVPAAMRERYRMLLG